ncbi:type IV toxin-antitoxin system AbiEi family antitoxin [Microbacterium sp. SA39]|uniref:type IV toxin-antitoxin system AbiEi family antitoxin n=1 Tax=Microbacterium sp. SA39 TaxID=1263625 RepID=UPI0005FA1256|nr:type IV toxin-antitoxin system AbiEi family antitoxin [Microbacterium sp. SA39]KJQ53292.1 hypothetical protein RS85_02806 [Microbacterium sp. SA39]
MRSGINQALQTLLRVVPPEFRPEPDGDTVRISRGSTYWVFHPVWAGEGLPADVRRVRNMITHSSLQPRGIPVITARRMSPGAREILSEEQLSWADAGGRAQIVVPEEVYITRLDPIPVDAGRRFKWSAAADAVAETLLAWQVRQGPDAHEPLERPAEIAETAGVSIPHAARVLRQFDEQSYTAKIGAERGSSAGRALRDPGRMLSDWAGHHAASSLTAAAEFHVPWREHQLSISMLAESLSNLDWAVTGVAAADRIAPYLTSIPTVDIYVSADALQEALQLLSSQRDVMQVDQGGRVRVFAESEYVFRLADHQDGLRVASPIRVYSDLLRLGGRAAEAAEYLREATIGF